MTAWWRRDPLDQWLLALRAGVLLGVVVWLGLAPLPAVSHRNVFWLLAIFTAYSALLYVAAAARPGHLGCLYRIAMLLDLVFVFELVRLTGGMRSSFYLGFYLLTALHAFYFGLTTGALAALLSTVLYVLVDGWPPPIEPSELGIRVAFLVLVGVCMGGLAEWERRKHEVVARLNAELRTQQDQLKEAQEHLIRSDRLATVGELAAGLAHDLRNPLAGIAGALHVLAGQLPLHDDRQALLTEVQDQIARMNKTLTDLLSQARPSAPQYLLLNINEVVEQSLWFLPVTGGAGIEIVKDLAAVVPPLRLDPSLIHQALLNILVNARQAMTNGGRIVVSTVLRSDGDGAPTAVDIAIADTGPGIDAHDVPNVFKPFFTTKAQGTGLGLAIAARIIEQHGGRITVETVPGRGATFRITLPVPREVRDADAIATARR